MEKIILRGIPMPPTSNKQYKPVPFKSKFGSNLAKLVKSEDSLKYEQEFNAWYYRNLKQMRESQVLVNEWIKNGYVLKIKQYVCFPAFDIWKKKEPNTPKEIDSTNRVKAIHDLLASALIIDDKYFFDCQVVKCKTNKEAHVNIILSPINGISIDDAEDMK